MSPEPRRDLESGTWTKQFGDVLELDKRDEELDGEDEEGEQDQRPGEEQAGDLDEVLEDGDEPGELGDGGEDRLPGLKSDLRDAPGLAGATVGRVQAGSKVTVTECAVTEDAQGVWFKISRSRQDGWVSARFVSRREREANLLNLIRPIGFE